MSYLLDTNVVSEFRKRQRVEAFDAWFAQVDQGELFLSALVIGEIAAGIARLEQRHDARQASLLERWLAEVKDGYAARILPISTAIAERWGRLQALRPLPPIDGLLAATALEHDLTLVTRDTAVAGTGVRMLDPWTA